MPANATRAGYLLEIGPSWETIMSQEERTRIAEATRRSQDGGFAAAVHYLYGHPRKSR